MLSALCFAVVVERILFRYKPMSELLKPEQVHDHGKFMLTFIMIWAYFAFSQWLIIWAGNLPEEITWYMRRLQRRLGIRGLVPRPVPFRGAVRVPAIAAIQARYHAAGLAGGVDDADALRDLFWIIEPNFSVTFHVTWLDIVVPIAMGGLWLAYFFRNLSSMPLVPAYDVFAVEVLEPRTMSMSK